MSENKESKKVSKEPVDTEAKIFSLEEQIKALRRHNEDFIKIINNTYDKLINAAKSENSSFEMGRIAEALRVQFTMVTNQKVSF